MKHLTTLILMLMCINSFGSISLDTIPYLTPQDSVFLTVDEANQKFIHHKLDEGQTLYSLAKFYGLDPLELGYTNEGIFDGSDLSIGSIINVPIPNRAIKRYKTKNFDESKHARIFYIVKPGDNLFHISKRLFKMPVEDVQERNGIVGTTINVGQLLHLGWISTEGVPEKIRKSKPLPPEWSKSKAFGYTYNQAKGIKTERTQKGVGYWNKNSKNTVDIFALHSHAPVNSIIEVTNPMNSRTLYAKVTGRPSSNVYRGQNVVIVLSHKAARMLGARDSRFYVQVNYLK